MRRMLPFIFTVVALLACFANARAGTDRKAYALSLLEDGRRHLARGGVEQRRAALSLFEEAALVAPRDPAVLVMLGDAYADARYLHRARTVYERALGIAPADADVHFGFGRIIRREWLDSGWESDLESAADELRDATRLRPGFVQALTALVALDVELGDLAHAREAAEQALTAAPQQAEAQLVAGEMAYRSGEIGRADSLFRLALAQLAPAVAERFNDVTPLVPVRDGDLIAHLAPAERAAYARRFWSANDPDPVTPRNEAQLEYWSRQAHALMLLGDPWGPIWRGRTAVYVRYGKRVQVDDAMRGRHFEMPRLDLGEVVVAPTPQQLERISLVTAGSGQSAFAPLSPGTQPMALAVRVMRFETVSGASLMGQVEASGEPADTLVGECVVLDAADSLVAHATRNLSPSACDPLGKRAGDFVFTVPPGTYRLAFAVRDAGNRRGTSRVSRDVLPPADGLSMSEIAPNCGPPQLATSREGVRLNPNPRARVEGSDPLVAYFEIYHLHTNDRGASRFEYQYRVRELGAPGVPWYHQKLTGQPAADALRFQTTQLGVGALRRQFIQVPTKTLPAGRYELELTVRDLATGQEAKETMPFSRLWSQEELTGDAPLPESRR
jgi:Tfp pilus assembly protein PilF